MTIFVSDTFDTIKRSSDEAHSALVLPMGATQ